MGEYQDFYLKAPNQEAFDAVVPENGWDGVNIDRVGILYRETAQVGLDEWGGQYPIYIPTEGYHVNVRSSVGLPDELKQFEIPAPADPKRVWA